MAVVKRSKRFENLAKRPVHQDDPIGEWEDVGLFSAASKHDPKPSIKVEGGKVVEMDGKRREDFDMIEQFVADYAIDVNVAEEAMAKSDIDIARMLVDIHIPRSECVRIFSGLTAAKINAAISKMSIAEIIMAYQKTRAIQTPGSQCHTTNAKDDPVLMAADAAESALRGFREEETTVRVVRYAPFNALALLVGGATGRPGVLTQDAVEEAFELEIGMRGLTSYAETVSVYGTESVFVDGDDTPWSKTFLAGAYASRGIKLRFTSGSGSEIQMGASEGKSMLYLETLCLMITRGAGVQGIQNGGISCIGVAGNVPSGLRGVAGENLIAQVLDLECASGNDQIYSTSETRRTARTAPQLFGGSDLIWSGYGSIPNYDNMFAGACWDILDIDDVLTIQRDFKLETGLRPVKEEDVIVVRNKAARAMQAIFAEFGFPPVTDEEVELATYACGSEDVGDRNIPEDLKAADRLMKDGINAVDVAKALSKHGFRDIAEGVVLMLRQRVAGDYMQTSAWVDKDGYVYSAINDPNTYMGPGTGYQMSAERWAVVKDIPWAVNPEDF